MRSLAIALVLISTPNELLDFAIPQWTAKSEIRIEDAYKWLYQATRGGEHAIPDEESARDWLESEWQTLAEPKPNEPLWQPLSPEGEIVRLNLRPFRARGGRMDELLAAFVESSRRFDNNQANFKTAWKELGKRLKQKPIGALNWKDWRELDRKMRLSGYPAIHHSESFNRECQPAYRILTGEAARKLTENLEP